jgi:hypothetical protein
MCCAVTAPVGLFSPTSEAEGGADQHISPDLRRLLSSSQIQCMHVCARSLPVGLRAWIPLAVLSPPTGGLMDPDKAHLTLRRAFFYVAPAERSYTM